MNKRNKILVAAVAVMFLATLSSCAEVGSDRWCKKMKEKPKADWSSREAKDYTKHCAFEKD